VLTLREGELNARLDARERDIDKFRLRLRALALRARKEQATIETQAARITALEDKLLARPQARTQRRRGTARRETSPKQKAAKVTANRAGEPRLSATPRLSAPAKRNAKGRRPHSV